MGEEGEVKNEKQSFKMLCMTRIYKRLMYSSLFYTQQPTAKKAWLHTTLPHYSSVRTFHDRPVRQARGIILTIFSYKQKKSTSNKNHAINTREPNALPSLKLMTSGKKATQTNANRKILQFVAPTAPIQHVLELRLLSSFLIHRERM